MSADGYHFHCADAADAPMARDAAPGGGTACFHPAEETGEPVAGDVGVGDGRLCFHPGDDDGGPTARHRADDLATDLHLSLTSIDEQHLAVLL